MSTNLGLVHGGKTEPLSQKVARRLRGQLGELRISGSSLARITGLTQSKVSRRLNGDAPLELDELEMIEEATGISVAYLLGFSDDAHVGGPVPNGGESMNPRASDYMAGVSEDVDNVISLWPGCLPTPVDDREFDLVAA